MGFTLPSPRFLVACSHRDTKSIAPMHCSLDAALGLERLRLCGKPAHEATRFSLSISIRIWTFVDMALRSVAYAL